MNRTDLTIVIPTYNREKQLRNTLKQLSKNRLEDIKIILLDNDSNYNINKFKNEFKELELTIIKNKYNIGGNANIARCFEIVETEWMWLLSDDDEPIENIITQIKKDIVNIDQNTILLKYSSKINQETTNQEVMGLEELINFLSRREPEERFGNLMFISSSIYRVSKLKDYILYAYQYTNAYFPQVAILLFFLDKNPEFKILFLKDKIVNLIEDRENIYTPLLVGVGILNSTKNMIFNISKEADLKMRKLFTLFTSSYRANFITLYFSDYSPDIKFNIYLELYKASKQRYSVTQRIESYFLSFLLLKPKYIKFAKRINSKFKRKIEESQEIDLYTRF